MRGRRGLVVVQTVLGLGLLVAWVWVVDLGEIGEVLSHAQWVVVLLAALVGLSSGVVRAVRWHFVLRPIAKVPVFDLWLISLASMLVNFVIPIRSGELARSLLLKQRHRVSMSASLPTVAVDRSFDLMAVLLIGVIGALSGISLNGQLSTVLLAGGVLLVAFIAFVLVAALSGERLAALGGRLVPVALGPQMRDRVLGMFGGFVKGFTAVGNAPRALVPMLILSLLSALFDGALFFLLFVSLGSRVPAGLVLTGYALFALTFLIPGAPGYIGSIEAFGSLVFGALGVRQEMAASTVVLYHALGAVMLGVTGGLAMWALGMRPVSAVKSFVEGNARSDNELRERT